MKTKIFLTCLIIICILFYWFLRFIDPGIRKYQLFDDAVIWAFVMHLFSVIPLVLLIYARSRIYKIILFALTIPGFILFIGIIFGVSFSLSGNEFDQFISLISTVLYWFIVIRYLRIN